MFCRNYLESIENNNESNISFRMKHSLAQNQTVCVRPESENSRSKQCSAVLTAGVESSTTDIYLYGNVTVLLQVV